MNRASTCGLGFTAGIGWAFLFFGQSIPWPFHPLLNVVWIGAIWFPSGQWEVENRGVAPDVEVEMDPQAWRAGHDPQLEKAVAVILEELKKPRPPRAKRPAYPNYHRQPGP